MIRTRLKFWRPILNPVIGMTLAVAVIVGCATQDPILPPPPVGDPAQAAQRGQELVQGFGACGFCHSADGLTTSVLAGGRVMGDKFGAIHGPNLTVSSNGIGGWSEADFKRVMRENLRPDGSEISSEFHKGYGWLADSDIAAITYYIRSLPPVDHQVERRELSFIDRNTTGFFDTRTEVKGYIPGISSRFKSEFGQYLADSVARCGSCHSKPEGIVTSEEYLAGGLEISFDGESKVAPNITQSKSLGIGKWSDVDFKQFLRTGHTPDGREVDARFCPVRFYGNAPEDHVDAVVAYLRTVPAIE